MKNYTLKELNEMLKGLKESLEVFKKAGDRESLYATKAHIRRIETELENRVACRHCHEIEIKDESEMCLECQLAHSEASEDR